MGACGGKERSAETLEYDRSEQSCVVFADSEAFGSGNNSDSGIVLDVQEPVVHTPTITKKKRQKKDKRNTHRTEHEFGSLPTRGDSSTSVSSEGDYN